MDLQNKKTRRKKKGGFKMKRILIHTLREEYDKDNVKTMTVAELIELLEEFEEDAEVCLSFDYGYTYGGIREDMFELEEEDEDEGEEW